MFRDWEKRDGAGPVNNSDGLVNQPCVCFNSKPIVVLRFFIWVNFDINFIDLSTSDFNNIINWLRLFDIPSQAMHGPSVERAVKLHKYGLGIPMGYSTGKSRNSWTWERGNGAWSNSWFI